MSVVVVTLVLLGFGLHGSTQILQRLDPLSLLPTDSYLSKYISTSRQYYPQVMTYMYCYQIVLTTGTTLGQYCPQVKPTVSTTPRYYLQAVHTNHR